MTDNPPPDGDERAFEFPLDGIADREPLYEDLVVEFSRQQLLSRLDVVVPTVNGKPVNVDGSTFLRDRTAVFALWRADGTKDT